MKNIQDAKDFKEWLDKNKKWYWCLPIVGFFIFQSACNKFVREHRLLLVEGTHANSKYQYVQFGSRLVYRSLGFDMVMKKVMKVHGATFGISLILLLAVEICVFNFAHMLLGSMLDKVIKTTK